MLASLRSRLGFYCTLLVGGRVDALPLRGPYNAAVDYGGHWATAENVAVKGRVAALRSRLVYVVGPGSLGVENRDIAGSASGQMPALEIQHTGRAGGK